MIIILEFRFCRKTRFSYKKKRPKGGVGGRSKDGKIRQNTPLPPDGRVGWPSGNCFTLFLFLGERPELESIGYFTQPF